MIQQISLILLTKLDIRWCLNMRKLQTQDIFKLAGIIRKLDLKKNIGSILAPLVQGGKNQDKLAEEVGFNLILTIFEYMDQAEDEITEFFASIAEVSPEEFRQMDLMQLGQFIDDLRQQSGIVDFFQLLSKMLGGEK